MLYLYLTNGQKGWFTVKQAKLLQTKNMVVCVLKDTRKKRIA